MISYQIHSLIVIFLSSIHFSQTQFSISKTEKDAIIYMREEEKLARDIYDSMYVKWEVNPFGNIRLSEQTHMDKIKNLVNTYKLPDPVEFNQDKAGVFTNAILQKYYKELLSTASISLTDALGVGAKIEELDISDLEDRVKQTNQSDIISTYQLLIRASENHLRAFVRRLKMRDINYEPTILSQNRFENIIKNKS